MGSLEGRIAACAQRYERTMGALGEAMETLGDRVRSAERDVVEARSRVALQAGV